MVGGESADDESHLIHPIVASILPLFAGDLVEQHGHESKANWDSMRPPPTRRSVDNIPAASPPPALELRRGALNTPRRVLEPPERADDGARDERERERFRARREARRLEKVVIQQQAREDYGEVQRRKLGSVSANARDHGSTYIVVQIGHSAHDEEGHCRAGQREERGTTQRSYRSGAPNRQIRFWKRTETGSTRLIFCQLRTVEAGGTHQERSRCTFASVAPSSTRASRSRRSTRHCCSTRPSHYRRGRT